MRKHRHFAFVFTALLGTGVVSQVPNLSALAATKGGGHANDTAGRTRSARLQTLSVTRPTVPASSDAVLALTTAMVPLPPPPPPPPKPVPKPVAAPAPKPAVAPSAPSSGVWAELRQCESGGNYSDNTGNGYYGAYQFSLSTWQGLGYSGLPSAAAPAVQDQAAQRLEARDGWSQWPQCARALGL